MVMRPRKAPKGEKLKDTIKTLQRTNDDLCKRLDVVSCEKSEAINSKYQWQADAQAKEKKIAQMAADNESLQFQIRSLEQQKAQAVGRLVGYRQHIKDMADPASIEHEKPRTEHRDVRDIMAGSRGSDIYSPF